MTLRTRATVAGGLYLGLSFAADQASAQDGADADLPAVRITRTAAPPLIDGRLDDAAWAGAAVITDFHQSRPLDHGSPTERTEIRLMYDDDALYIAGRFFETDPSKISANILKQKTGLRDDDRLAIVIDPFNARRGGYRFELNPNGVRLDGLYDNVGSFNLDWDGIWDGTSAIDSEGWTTELAIPFKTLSFDPSNDTWGMNFGRAIRRIGEEDAWVSRNRNYNPSIVGLVRGFSGMNQGVGLDVVPSLSAVNHRTFDPDQTQTDFDPTLDVFYKITPSLNAALTINTDFSATEVDERQTNFTRFGLFFPERRDFFLQDTDIFEFGNIGGGSSGGGRGNTATDRASQENARPFFSRRLGLSTTGEPVDLEYGGKISGRIGRFTIGNLLVRQDEFGTLPASDAFVGRATANVLGESSVGLIVTDGDPNSAVDNSLYGFDFRYLNSRLAGGRSIDGEAWYERSQTEDVSGDDASYGIGVRMPNNEGWRAGIAFKQVQRNFNPALGFVNRRGVNDRTADVGYTWFTSGRVQQVFSGVDLQLVDLLDGGMQSKKVSATPLEVQTPARDILKIRYIANEENVLTPFVLYSDPTRIVAVSPGSYDFDRYGFDVETGSQRKVSGTFQYRGGGFYGGDRLFYDAGVNWKPSRHFSIGARYEWNDVELPEGDFITRLVSLTTGWTFSSQLSWVTLFQYDNLSEVLGVNSRLHWIPREGREGFIVLNHNVQDFDKDDSFSPMSSDVTVKFSYTFRF
jgi:hypothetical protein